MSGSRINRKKRDNRTTGFLHAKVNEIVNKGSMTKTTAKTTRETFRKVTRRVNARGYGPNGQGVEWKSVAEEELQRMIAEVRSNKIRSRKSSKSRFN